MSDLTLTITESGGSVLHLLMAVETQLERGFKPVLDRWAREVAFPYIAENWPREDWAPLAASTVEEKARRGFPATPLIRTGKLYSAVTAPGTPGNIFQVDDFSVTLGVQGEAVPYAAAMAGGTGRTPARPWADLTGPPLVKLQQMIEEDLKMIVEGAS